MAEKESHMARDEEYLLYPLDSGDDPVCLRCGGKMLLASSEARPEKPNLLTFRCDRCGQSEKFLSDEP
jgi:hypothetical protein